LDGDVITRSLTNFIILTALKHRGK